MADNLQKKGPQDSIRINVNEAWEVRYWCRTFGCTETVLRKAVKEVGVSVSKVRAYLKKN